MNFSEIAKQTNRQKIEKTKFRGNCLINIWSATSTHVRQFNTLTILLRDHQEDPISI